MGYGPETHGAKLSYKAVIEHTPSAIRLEIIVVPYKVDGTTPTENLRDQVFRSFLDRLVGIPNTTLISATKMGDFIAPVTPS